MSDPASSATHPRGAAVPITAAAVLLAAYAGLYRIRTFDTLFHLAAGRYIVQRGAAPATDPFSFTFRGASWLDHSVWFQVGAFWLHRLGGFAALSLYQAGCAAALIGCALWRLRHSTVGVRLAGAWLALLPFAALREVIEVRPHAFGYLCLSLALVCCLRALERADARMLCALLPVYAFWSGSHGSHVLIYVLLAVGLACAGYFRDRTLLLGFGASIGLALAMTWMIAPLALSQGLEHATSTFLEVSVSEWYPVTPQDLAGTWPGSTFVLSVVLAITGAVQRARGVSISTPRNGASRAYSLALLCAFTLLAFTSRRMLGLFLFGAAPLWVPYAAQSMASLLGRLSVRAHAPRTAGDVLSVAGLLTLALVIASQGSTFETGVGLAPRRFPSAAVAAMRKAGRVKHLYNAYNYGGYLMFEGYPAAGVFVDGRAITVYPAEFLSDFTRAYADPARFEQLVARFDCDSVLLPLDSSVAQPLRRYLAQAPRWKLTYRDAIAEVYER